MSESTQRLNIQRLAEPGTSTETAILEVPKPTSAAHADANAEHAESFWSVHWMQYDLDGQSHPVVYTTYYNDEDGWYLILPDDVGRRGPPWHEGCNTGSGERGATVPPITVSTREPGRRPRNPS